MKLYHCIDAIPDSLPAVTSILTPLGNVRLEAAIDQETVSNTDLSVTYRLRGGGWLAGSQRCLSRDPAGRIKEGRDGGGRHE